MVGGSHIAARHVLGWKIAQEETLSNHYIRMEVTFHLREEYSDLITNQRLFPPILGIGTIHTLPYLTMRLRETTLAHTKQAILMPGIGETIDAHPLSFDANSWNTPLLQLTSFGFDCWLVMRLLL